jgi:hypothetical protein
MKQLELNLDEQTDDNPGVPRLEGTITDLRIPPCTGYESDYERIERAERNSNWG